MIWRRKKNVQKMKKKLLIPLQTLVGSVNGLITIVKKRGLEGKQRNKSHKSRQGKASKRDRERRKGEEGKGEGRGEEGVKRKERERRAAKTKSHFYVALNL